MESASGLPGTSSADGLWNSSAPLALLGLQLVSPHCRFWTCQPLQLQEPISYNKSISIHSLLVLFLWRTLINTLCPLRLDHLCKLTAIQLRGPATVFFKTPGPGFPGGLVVKNSLPVQGTSVWSLVWKDPTSGGTAKPMCHNYWPSALEPVSHSCWSPGTWSPRSATRGVTAMRSLHTQLEISPHRCHD